MKGISKVLEFILKIRESTRNARMRSAGIKQAKRLMNESGHPKLDLGCGQRKRTGFIGIDLRKGADIQWDIRWGLPFRDNCVFEIRSDHFLEHLELPLVVKVLRECRRCLVPGGVLDFTIPHIDPYLDAYCRKDIDFLIARIHDIPPGQTDLYNTSFDRISWLLYRAGEHKSLFDKQSILSKVKLAGFSNVSTREYEEAKDIKRRFSSIYVVAMK